MSVLLRRPATVPSLFSRALDPDPPAPRSSRDWRGLADATALLWAGVMLVEVVLVRGGAAAAVLTLPR